MAEYYRKGGAALAEGAGKIKPAKLRRWSMVGITAAYVLVLVAGMGINGLVEAQAQQEARAAAVLQAEAASNQMALEAREDSALVLSARAAQLSQDYQADWEARMEEAASTQASGPVVPAWSYASGVFEASAYNGYTGQDQIAYWKSINSDTIGWLRIPGTNISHPIVQNTQDVNYYTSRGYYKEPSYYGVIWTNPNTTSGSYSELSPNTVLYGHNWTNYSASPRVAYAGDIMFGQLTGYHYLSTAQSYPYFYYSTPKEEFTVVIFACFYTEEAFQYNQTYGAGGDMNYTINEARARSRHTFDVDVNASDKIVTLSTCTRAYGATSNQRFVVMGRVLRPGETVGPVTVTSNYNHKQPSVW